MQKGRGFFYRLLWRTVWGLWGWTPWRRPPQCRFVGHLPKAPRCLAPWLGAGLWGWPWPAECGRCPPVPVPDRHVRQWAWPPGGQEDAGRSISAAAKPASTGRRVRAAVWPLQPSGAAKGPAAPGVSWCGSKRRTSGKTHGVTKTMNNHFYKPLN